MTSERSTVRPTICSRAGGLRSPPSRVPDLPSQSHGAVSGAGAEQAHPAQDEGVDRGLELGPRGVADGRDVAPEGDVRKDRRQQRPADVVDRAAEPCGFQRARSQLELLGRRHLVGSQPAQVGLVLRPPRHRHHPVASPGEHRDGRRPDATGGAGDDDRPLVRRLAVYFHAVQGERRGEAGCSERHRRPQVEAVGHPHHPVGRGAHHLGQAAVVCFAQTHAIDEDRIAGVEPGVGRRLDAAGHVDPGVDGEALVDGCPARNPERVLEVDPRPLRADHDLARREVVHRHFHHAGDNRLLFPEHAARSQLHGGIISRSGPHGRSLIAAATAGRRAGSSSRQTRGPAIRPGSWGNRPAARTPSDRRSGR